VNLQQTPNLSNCDTVKKTTFIREAAAVKKSTEPRTDANSQVQQESAKSKNK